MTEKLKRKPHPDKHTRPTCARLALIPLALFALCTLCSVVGMNWFMSEMNAIGDTANDFMLALRDGNTDVAFAMATAHTQDEWQSQAYLQEYIERPADWSFNSFSSRNNTGRISGSVQLANDITTPLVILLRQHQDGWQITGIFYGE